MKQLSATFISRTETVLSQFFVVALHRAVAEREIEDMSQSLLFEECIPSIDNSKEQQVGGVNTTEQRMTDNVFRCMQAFVCDQEILWWTCPTLF